MQRHIVSKKLPINTNLIIKLQEIADDIIPNKNLTIGTGTSVDTNIFPNNILDITSILQGGTITVNSIALNHTNVTLIIQIQLAFQRSDEYK